MVVTIADVLAGLIGVGIIVVGANALLFPRAAKGFGIPCTPAEDGTFQAWLRVKSVRDIGTGLLTLVVLAGGTSQLLGWFMLAAALIPTGDALIVLRNKGPKATAYGVHAATAAVAVASAVLLLTA
jgi:Domain of unknown function (DUF4267)